jgi:phosphate:Na+ symporter
MYLSLFLLMIGMASFLGGMWMMRTGLENLAIDRLPLLLKRFVKTPTRGMITGIVITMLLQSSAAVMLITIGLVAARQMTFTDSIGVILGSNVGTSVTVQLLALQPTQLILPAIVLGLLLTFLLRGTKRYIGLAIFGFGLMLFSLEMMTYALTPLGQTAWFRRVLTFSSQNPFFGVLAGTLLTSLIQSSTATTTLTIALAADGLIDLPGAIAIVLGNNIGSCITSVIASIGNTLSAKRVAAAHVALNVVGVIVFLPLIHPYAALVNWFADTLPMQVATSHTLFNVLSTLAAWPVARPFAGLIERLLPHKGQ